MDQRLTKLNHKVTDQQLTELIFGLAMPTYAYTLTEIFLYYVPTGF